MAYSGGYNSSSTNPGAGTSRPSANLYNDPLSNWADQNSFTKEFWIQQELQQAIYNLTPIRYYFLKLFLSRPMIEKTRSEFTYTEVPFERSSFIATAGVAQGTTNSTQVIPVADGVAATVAVNGRYQYASEVIGIVNSVVTTPGSNTVTIAPALGASLPAVTSGDTFSFLAPTIADGMQTYNNFETVNLLSRFNYITRFMRNKAYTEQEWQELVNSERVNFLEEDKQQMMDQFLFDQMVTFFTDQRGSYGVTEGSGTLQAMSTDGFFSIMKRDGAAYGTATPATLINKFKTLLQDTNVSTSMNERWAIGTEKVLARISDAFKQDRVRYSADDHTVDNNIDTFKIGTQTVRLVPGEIFNEIKVFPKIWQGRLIVLDPSTINPTCIKGLSPVKLYDKLDRRAGLKEDYFYHSIQGYLGVQMNNVQSSFWMDIQGL